MVFSDSYGTVSVRKGAGAFSFRLRVPFLSAATCFQFKEAPVRSGIFLPAEDR